jgi:hypothetical protein
MLRHIAGEVAPPPFVGMIGRFDDEPARMPPAREPRGHTPKTACGRLIANQDGVGAGQRPPGIVATRDPGE